MMLTERTSGNTTLRLLSGSAYRRESSAMPSDSQIAHALFDAQSAPSVPSRKSFDEILFMGQHSTGWTQVFKQLKSEGLIQEQTLGTWWRGGRIARSAAAGRSWLTPSSSPSELPPSPFRFERYRAASNASSRAVARSQSNWDLTKSCPLRASRLRKSASSTNLDSPQASASTSRRGATTAVRPSIA